MISEETVDLVWALINSPFDGVVYDYKAKVKVKVHHGKDGTKVQKELL